VCSAVAPLIISYCVIALTREKREDLAPRVGQLREAMDAEDQTSVWTRICW
jgi:hypothetical protein